MGHILSIPAVVKAKRNEIFLEPEKNLGELIEEYLGTEAKDIYHELLQKDEPDEKDWKEISVDLVRMMEKLLEKSKITRKAVQEVYDEMVNRIQP